MAHVVRRSVGSEPHHTVDLKRADAFLAGQHEIDDLEPSPQRDIGVLENRSDQDGEPICATLPAVRAFPMERTRFQLIDALAAAPRATHNAIGPTPNGQVSFTGIIIREQLVELVGSHLLSEPNGAHRSAPRV